jgi:hypothetical protein
VTDAYLFDGRSFGALDWQPRRALRWAAWRPNGSAALLVGNGGYALLFDGERLQTLSTGTKHNLRGAAWSPDGRTALLAGNQGAVLRLQGESFENVAAPVSENLRRVAWHPGGDYALIVGNGGTVLRYDAANRELTPLPGDRAHTLRAVAFRPDGAYALVGAYASRWAGYPRPHALYRCDGRYLQALLASDDEDDFVAVDWSVLGLGLAAGYAWRAAAPAVSAAEGPALSAAEGAALNKLLLYDGSTWRMRAWQARGVVLGGAWQPDGQKALLVGENGLAVAVNREGEIEELETGTTDNLIGPFWPPRRVGAAAIVLKGPGDKVYTV